VCDVASLVFGTRKKSRHDERKPQRHPGQIRRLDLYLLTYFNMVGETRQVAVSDVGSRCKGAWTAVGIGRSGGPLAAPAFELCRAERF
jgi:hypothetical protein